MTLLPKRLMMWLIPVILIVLYAGCGAKENGKVGDGPDPAFDDFERATLGSNWTVYNGNVGIVNNSDIGIISKSGRMLGLGIVVWSGTTFAADQFSEAVISPDKDPNAAQQVFVRRRTSDSQRYGFHWNPADGGRWELKLDGGRAAPVLATAAPAPRPAPGDTMRIEVVGNTIKGFHNNVEVIIATDSVLTESGQPGMALIGGVTLPAPIVESWTGGSLRASSSGDMSSP